MILANKQSRRSTGVVLIDTEIAFDSIRHNDLIYKLHVFGYPAYLIKLIRNFLEGRRFMVDVQNYFSSRRNIPAELPQGSVLSPTLYSIFTSDVVIARKQNADFYAQGKYLTPSSNERKRCRIMRQIFKKMEDQN